jgi:hypothetical protein
MEQNNYQCVITAAVSAEEAFDSICDVRAWWAKQLEGSTTAKGDRFTVRFGPTFVTFEITGFVPGKKIDWQVTDCYLHWINDKHEWTGTQVSWEIEPTPEGSRIRMTHHGLVPRSECFNDCQAGWNDHIGNSLKRYMTEQVGMPV